jgi:quercetin dioxygenase-like cupin family protein
LVAVVALAGVVTSMAPASGQAGVVPIFGAIDRSSIHSDFSPTTPEETSMLHATARVLKCCGALGVCAALAVCTVYVTSAAQSVKEGQPRAGAVAQSRDDLAGKLARREVQRSPLSIPGREIVQVETLIPAGVESGWHVHPGEEVGYIIAGQVEMMVQGRSTVVLNAGDGFLIPPRTPHNARDLGPETGRMLSTYIVEPGQPIATFVDPPVQK